MTEAADTRLFTLSFAQQRFWMLDRLWPGHPAFNVATAIELQGPLDRPRLEHALQQLQQRHEILRTSFVDVDGEVFQRIHPTAPIDLVMADWCDAPPPDRQTRTDAFAAEFAAGRFDLTVAPLFRAALIRLEEAQHVLVVVFHHSICDGWSLNVFLSDLGALYDTQQEYPDGLAALEIQVVDHAAWQRQHLARQTRLDGSLEPVSSGLEFWMRHLAGAAPLADLITDRPRPVQPDFSGGCERVLIPARLAEKLRELSRRNAVTLFATLLSAFASVIAGPSELDEVVIGVPVAGRTRSELTPLIGCFLNTLPLRLRVQSEMTVAATLRRTQAVLAEAFAHQDVPIEEIVAAIDPERSRRHAPLFQIVCGMNNVAGPGAPFRDLSARMYHCHHGFTQFDLVMNLDDAGSAVTGEFEFGTAIFDRATARRILAGYLSRLRAIVDGRDDRCMRALAWWPPGGLRACTAAGTGPMTDEPAMCLHELVEAAASRTPDAIAVTEEGRRSISYAQLGERVRRMAQALRCAGVVSDQAVAIYLPRSIDMVVACLGVLAAGGAYLPLDPADPPQRTRHILDDAGVALAVTDVLLEATMTDAGLRAIVVSAADREDAVVAPATGSDARSLAYVIYTSGSTGTPRGVEVEHRSVVNHLRDARRRIGIGPGDVFLAAATPTFDISVMELFLPLSSGAQLFIPDRETLLDGRRLQTAIDAYGVSFMQSVPTQWRQYLETGWRASPDVTAICGGEEMSPSLADSLLGRLRAVWNMYGPTEATIWCTGTKLVRGEPVTVGRPIANARIRVLDREGRALPVGSAGEIHIGGCGVARGYRGRPDATEQRFIADPADPGERMYRTGDRGLIQSDGQLRFLGRIDQQIKIRGCRVEPEEVAAAVRCHPSVRQAAVVSAAGPHGETVIVAYVVLLPLSPCAGEDIRRFLRDRLPNYMVPAAVVILDALPVAASGKLDRQALPPPRFGEEQPGAPSRPAQTAVETGLAELWARVLGAEPRSMREPFFAVGGTSLLAVRLMALIRSQFGVDLPMGTIFEAQTIADLAQLIGGRSNAVSSCLVPFPGEKAATPLFLVHPTGGFAHCYAALADELAGVASPIGIQQRGLEGDRGVDCTIPSMAEHYLAEIRRHTDGGPFCLAGWSLGGVIAFEMAHQSCLAGRPVRELILIDTPAPLRGFYEVQRDDAAFAVFLSEQLSRLFGARLEISEAEMACREHVDRYDFLAARLLAAGLMTEDAARDFVARFAAVHRAADAAARSYTPPRLTGDLLLLRCRDLSAFDQTEREAHPALADDFGWGTLVAGAVTVADVPGTHQTVLSMPYVTAAAKVMREYLARRGGANAS